MLTLKRSNPLLSFYWIKHGSIRKSFRKHPLVAFTINKSTVINGFRHTFMTMVCIRTPKLTQIIAKNHTFVFKIFISDFSFQLASPFPIILLENALEGRLTALKQNYTPKTKTDGWMDSFHISC